MDREPANFPWSDSWPEITDARVRAAFARVPRAQFVPEALRQWADRDAPLPIGEDQTISQPYVVAWMTQALQLAPGQRTLEIGTGSGYQTAILCELSTGEDEMLGQNVYSIERFQSLAQQARVVLNTLGYHPHLRHGDGALGWPQAAPFAAVIVTAAAAYLPRPLWTQLAEGGRMVIPIGGDPETQLLWLLRKVDGSVKAQPMGGVRFVPMVSPVLDDPTMRVELRAGGMQ